jgi:demethylmenaquinone methyltransferase/2-methoxy-6-polyprenyl-1,4-benzoquinol methylase
VSLRRAISTPDGKRRYVRRLFATIADRYDLITRVLSYGRDASWKRRLLGMAAIGAADRVLDLACGTGDLAFGAAAHAQRVVGLDITWRMVQLARAKHTDRAPVWFLAGDMLALPFPHASFEVVTTGYGLRNVPDLERALAEIHRVLTPGGRLLSLDFNRPANPVIRTVYLAYLTLVGSALGFVLHGDPDTYRYIPESIRNYPGAPAVAALMERQGFERVRVFPVLGGLLAVHVAEKSQSPNPKA